MYTSETGSTSTTILVHDHKGSIFDSETHVLVNPVNCVGVMGKGLALEFKKRYPKMFIDYQNLCGSGDMKIGNPMMWESRNCDHAILLFPTKKHWKDDSKLSYIVDGLECLVTAERYRKIKSIAVPALGCGLGGLPWEVVKPVMRYYLSKLNIPVEIYPPKEYNERD